MQRLPLQKTIRKTTNSNNTQNNKTPTPKPIRLQRGKNKMNTGRLDIELKASGAEALNIPNPNKARNVMVPCLTQKKVKEVISELHIKVLKACEQNDTLEQYTLLHDSFVWANKELQLKGE